MIPLTSTILDKEQLERFKDHWRRKGKTEQEMEPLLREYEQRVLADEPLTPEQQKQADAEQIAFLRGGLGLTEEEIKRVCGK